MIDAPYWILTGKTVLSQRPGALVENWEGSKNTKGTLHIKLDDFDYTIVRGRNPSVLTLNGDTVSQDKIDELLPLSDAALRRTLLLGQRSSLFLDLRPEDKSRLFSETLDLDRWLKASDRAGEAIRTLDRTLHGVKAANASAESLLDMLKDQHDEASNKEERFGADKTNRLAKIGCKEPKPDRA
jgi:DNA repair exonuclease SbcCD ATPase subunit